MNYIKYNMKKKNGKVSRGTRRKEGINKTEMNIVEKVSAGRNRLNIEVLDATSFPTIPQCSHGPCLLFSDKLGKKWFSCAVFRSSNECNVNIPVNDDKILGSFDRESYLCISRPLDEYDSVKKKFNSLISNNIDPFWCAKCLNYVECPHLHSVDGPHKEVLSPFCLLTPLQNDKGEAQYWFSTDVLRIVSDVLLREKVHSILNIGTPTLFDYLSKKKRFRQFLLDIDDRMSLFYAPNEFARYSMLNNHFFHEDSKLEVDKFLRSAKKLAIICDPPFACFVKPLMKSLNSMKQRFLSFDGTNSEDCKFIVFLPIFVGKHILKEDSTFSMVDYKVTYTNHRLYAKPKKSIVRVFTDFTNKSFDLSREEGYKFCALCDRFVANENRHCDVCGFCTSRDGTPYNHCFKCSICVKSTYSHCNKCVACHLRGRCIKC